MKPWEKYGNPGQSSDQSSEQNQAAPGPWQKYQPQPVSRATGQKVEAPAASQMESPGLMDASLQMTGGLVEPVLAIGSSGVGQIAGGLAGLGALAITGAGRALGVTDVEPAFAAESVRSGVADTLTYSPRTAGGSAAMQVVSAPAVPVAAGAEKATEIAGEGVYTATGSPAAGAVAAAVPSAVAQYLGVRIPGIKGSGVLDPTARGRTASLPRTQESDPVRDIAARRAEDIQAGSTSGELAPYKVSDKWRGVEKDKLANDAIKQGFDESVISAIKQAAPDDRKKMMRMLAIRQRGHNNARYAMDNRASDVAGDSLVERVRHVKRTNQLAGRQLDAVAKKLQGKPVDYSEPVQGFVGSLREMGITLDGQNRPVFRGSDIEGVDAAERVVRNIVARMRDTRTPDAYDLHRLKRFIDEQVTYGKSKDGLGGRTERVLKKLRSDLDRTLDTAFPEYNRVNTTYSDTVGALDSLQDAAGTKVNLYGENADKAVGTVLRRLMNNTQSRVNLMDSIDELETVANRYGGKFSDDLKAQMLFADELDKRFGATARTSLQGEIEKGTRAAARAAAGDATGAALDVGISKLDKLRGISDENAFRAMRDLLR